MILGTLRTGYHIGFRTFINEMYRLADAQESWPCTELGFPEADIYIGRLYMPDDPTHTHEFELDGVPKVVKLVSKVPPRGSRAPERIMDCHEHVRVPSDMYEIRSGFAVGSIGDEYVNKRADWRPTYRVLALRYEFVGED